MIFTVLAVTLLFGSCAKEEVLERSTQGTIGFETFLGKTSRAQETIEWAENSTMLLAGYVTDTKMENTLAGATLIEHMDHVTATYKGSSWSYSPVAYWVDKKYHSFFAVSPASTTPPQSSVTLVAGKAAINVADAIENQVDLMVADPVKEQATYEKGVTTVKSITFTMRHVLSQILFRAKIAVDDASVSNVRITSVKIAPKSGSFLNAGTVDIVGKTNPTGPNIIASPSGSAASYTLTPGSPVAINNAGYTPIKHQTDHVAMLLPQDAPVFVVTAKVIYTMAGSDQPEQEITFDAGSITWEPNLRYAYNLNIDVPVQILKKEPIKIGSVTIIQWGATTDVDLEDGVISGEVIDPDFPGWD